MSLYSVGNGRNQLSGSYYIHLLTYAWKQERPIYEGTRTLSRWHRWDRLEREGFTFYACSISLWPTSPTTQKLEINKWYAHCDNLFIHFSGQSLAEHISHLISWCLSMTKFPKCRFFRLEKVKWTFSWTVS